jgi:ribosomal protein S27E
MADESPADVRQIPAADLQKIIDRIRERVPDAKCPSCGHEQFSLSPLGYFFNTTFPDKEAAQNLFGPKSMIPTMAVICQRCGYVGQYALGTLGLIDLIEKRGQNG